MITQPKNSSMFVFTVYQVGHLRILATASAARHTLRTSHWVQGNPSSNVTSIPYTFVLGLLTACWSLTGYDSAVHVIEVRAPTACH